VVLFAGATAARAEDGPSAETPEKRDARLQWWRDARFGMFIHWGPVSIRGTEIGWSRGAQVPVAEYDSLYKQFDPKRFDADEWVRIAKAAGMKYVVFTSKHHDGFCMFDTKQTDFNVMNSPFHRDVCKELAEACRRQGLRFCTYHSVCDWHHPDFPLTSPGGSVRREASDLDRYNAYLKAQVKELITQYGPLGIMWFDVPQMFDGGRGKDLLAYTRSLQPDIIVNNRSGGGGDYGTPEQHIGGFNMKEPWETCMTICNQWAWKPDDPMKSLDECLRALVFSAGGDGNLLFNVGPMPTGEIEPRQVARLRGMGRWLDANGESIYGTRGGPYRPTKALASTCKGNVVYLHIFNTPGDSLTLPPLPKTVLSASILGGGTTEFRQTPEALTISLPAQARPPIDTIVKLTLDGPAIDIAPIRPKSDISATASNVFQDNPDFDAEMALDGDPGTRWATDAGTHKAWLEVDYAKPVTLAGVRIREEYDRVRAFEIQCKAGDTWKTLTRGKTLGKTFEAKFAPAVTASQIRLSILDAVEGPSIDEFEVIRVEK
jgi:alpha-L-fucosidase